MGAAPSTPETPTCKEYKLQGFVRRLDGSPVPNQPTRVFDIDLRHRQLLGQCETDDKGHYLITYTSAEFRRAEKASADLRVEAIDCHNPDRVLGSSPILFNASEDASLDVVLGGDEVRGPSEYDALLAAIRPVLDGVDVADLVENADHQDATFLVGETGVDRDHLEILILAHKTASTTGVDARLLYALFRQGGSTDLQSLFQIGRDDLLASARAAVGENIIDVRDEELVAMVDRFVAVAVQTAAGQGKPGAPVVPSKASEILKAAAPKGLPAVMEAYSTAETTESFWAELASKPETKDSIEPLQRQIQLGTVTLNHKPLIDLLTNGADSIKSFEDLAKYRVDDWLRFVNTKGIGVPDEISGADLTDRSHVYATSVARLVEAAMPTEVLKSRLSRPEESENLPFDGASGKSDIVAFLKDNSKFDINGVRIAQVVDDNSYNLGSIQDMKAFLSNMNKIQRLYSIAPRLDQVRPLLSAGIHSSLQIAKMGRQRFVDTFAASLGNATEAEQVFDRAEYTHAAALSLVAEFRARGIQFTLPTLINVNETLHANPPKQIPDWSTLFQSQDSCSCDGCHALDSPAAYYVDILHFLKDRTISVTNRLEGVHNPKDLLFLRRPDLGEIELTCSNTKTALPYIDLSNEIMEDAVAPPPPFVPFDLPNTAVAILNNTKAEDLKPIFKSSPGGPEVPPLEDPKITVVSKSRNWTVDEPGFTYNLEAIGAVVRVSSRSRQTTGTAKELAALPQYMNHAAYDRLSTLVYPLKLPFHLPLVTVRTYLNRLGVDKWALMEAFSQSAYVDILDDSDVAIEYLGLSPGNAKIITGEISSQSDGAQPGQWNLWGFARENLDDSSPIMDPADKLSPIHRGNWIQVLTGRVDVFLQQLGITYLDLLNLIELAPLVAGGSKVEVGVRPREGAPVDTCDLKLLQVVGLNDLHLHRILQFVRLWRGLEGWSMLSLAKAFVQFSQNTELPLFGLPFLVYISQLHRLSKTLRLPVETILLLFSDLDLRVWVDNTESDDTKKPRSQFDLIFNSNTVTGEVEFKPNIDPATPLNSHIPGLIAALNISSGELSLLLSQQDLLPNQDASVSNLSILYRHTVLAKALELPISDYLSALRFISIDPFRRPAVTLDFCKRCRNILASGFTVTELNYLLAQEYIQGQRPVNMDDIAIGSALDGLRARLQKIMVDNMFQPAMVDDKGTSLKAKLSILSWEPEVIAQLISILNNTASFEVVLNATQPVDSIFPDHQDPSYPVSKSLQDKISYDATSGKATFRGVMTVDEKTSLLSSSAGLPQPFVDQVDNLFQAPRQFIARNASTFEVKQYSARLDALPTGMQIPVSLQQKVYFDSGAQALVSKGALSNRERDLLISAAESAAPSQAYVDAVEHLFTAPDSANPSPAEAFLTKADISMLFNSTIDQGTENTPYRRFQFVFELLLPYVLNTQADEAIARTFIESLGLDSQSANFLIDRKRSTSGSTLRSIFRDNTFIQMSAEVLSTRSLFPDQFGVFELLLKSALIVSRLRLTTTQLKWLFNFREIPGDPAAGWLSLVDLPTEGAAGPQALFPGWERLMALVNLRDNIPGGEATLNAVFLAARSSTSTVNDLLKSIYSNTKLSTSDITFLVGPLAFNLQFPADFKDEISLSRLFRCLLAVQKLGSSAQDAQALAQPDSDFKSYRIAIQTAKSRYDQSTWDSIARLLRNTLREEQRKALVACLTSGNGSKGPWFYDANDVFSYYLIDVEMSTCQLTSRLKQAICSVQLFTQRCLMNLEEGISAEADKDSAWSEWAWMKYENVHAANYQVLMNPENYMEPELRDDQTDFFHEFRTEIQQSDITNDTAVAAYGSYLDKLDTISRLEVVSYFHEKEYLQGTGNPSRDIMHILARTRRQRPQYYYRQREDSLFWKSGWTRIDADIEGNHIMPIIWNGKLYLFWLSFHQRQDSGEIRMPKTGDSVQHTQSYFTTTLCWVFITGGKFSAKTTAATTVNLKGSTVLSGVTMTSAVEPDGGPLEVQVVFAPKFIAVFRFAGVNGEPTVELRTRTAPTQPNARINNMSFLENRSQSKNQVKVRGFLIDQTLLTKTPGQSIYSLVCPPQEPTFASQRPFFFQEGQRSFLLDTIPRTFSFPTIRIAHLLDPSWMQGDLINKQIVDQRPRLPILDRPLPDPVFAGKPKIIQSGPIVEGSFADNTLQSSIALPEVRNTALISRVSTSAGLTGGIFLNPILDINKIFLPSPLLMSTTYRFSLCYHPFVKNFMAALGRGGVDGLLDRPTQLLGYNKRTFQSSYGPTNAIVKDAVGEYAEEVVDFEDGAFAVYNWELFFHAPLLIADRLSKNQRFQEAQKWFHFIFDPTDASSLQSPERFWITKKFFLTTRQTYVDQILPNLFRFMASRGDPAVLGSLTPEQKEALRQLEATVAQWRKNPFNPFVIARTRTTAFQKMVVMKYLDNLIAWGDSLFRGDTIERVNEATQVYVLAAQILGKRPTEIPARAQPKVQTFNTLEPNLDSLSNGLVHVEQLVQQPVLLNYTRTIGLQPKGSGPALVAQPSMLFFCIPPNDKLLSYWTTVEDRLFKIRHCMNLQGVVRQLPLFDPPIDPMLLVKAAASGVDISTALSDINAPLPHYRFQTMVQRALDICSELKSLGSALAAALEKRDAEALALLRSGQEMGMNNLVALVKAKAVDEATSNADTLQRGKDIIQTKYAHYTSQSFMNEFEEAAMVLEGGILLGLIIEAVALASAGGIFMIPEIKVGCPTTIGATLGGGNFGKACEMFAAFMHNTTGAIKQSTGMLTTLGAYQHRKDEWDLQKNIADGELKQFDAQIAAAGVRTAMANQEVKNHAQQTKNSRDLDDFMRSKFTNNELYNWMVGQISTLYFQSYQLAYDTAKRAEQAFRYETGNETSSFIQFGYWDSLKKGLLAGESLFHNLKQMEMAYLEQDVREYEISSSISLAQLDPLALIQLRETGNAFFSLPESLFDVRYPGHYFRRIKSVAVTMPCVVGPYVSVNATLTLLKSSVRTSPLLASDGRYRRSGPNDPRFRDSFGLSQSIVTSSGQNDTGVFADGGGDRYLPFERSGAVSSWRIQLPPMFRQFDYGALTDVVLHARYTAREGGDPLRDTVQAELKAGALAAIELAEQNSGLARLVSLRHEPNGLYRFLAKQSADNVAQTSIDLSQERFPFLLGSAEITINRVQVMVFVNKRFRDRYTDSTMQFWLSEPVPSDGGGSTPVTVPSEPALQLASWVDGYRATKEFKKKLPTVTLTSKLVNGEKMDVNAIDDIMLIFYYSAKWPV